MNACAGFELSLFIVPATAYVGAEDQSDSTLSGETLRGIGSLYPTVQRDI